MASMWRRAMHYLGLGPDDDYDDHDAYDDITGEHQRPLAVRPPPGRTVPPAARRDHDHTGSVRTLSPSLGDEPHHNGNGTAADHHIGPRVPPSVADRSVAPRPRPAVVRPIAPPAPSKPHVVCPGSFNDAQEIADEYKGNVPVILNLQGVERDLARRIIDFASGLCYGLGGHMERVANQVYLLTPSDVEVSAEERRRLHERGYEA